MKPRPWYHRIVAYIMFELRFAPNLCAFHSLTKNVRYSFLTDRANCKYCKKHKRKGFIDAKTEREFDDGNDWPSAGNC